jgi:hypothetical protein
MRQTQVFEPPEHNRVENSSYIERVTDVRYLLLLLAVSAGLPAAGLKPETVTAFDRYVKLAEDGSAQHQGFEDFLWMDHHSKEKSLVWLGQSTVIPAPAPDQGAQIEVPDGVIQHWLGMVYLEKATLDKVHDILLNFNEYHNMIPLQIQDSKATKKDGDETEAFLRLYKKQLSAVVLNVTGTAKYTLLDPTRGIIVFHSSKIAEVEHPRSKKSLDRERPAEDAAGYLWRLNFYLRMHQADNGVYVEIELITLAREAGGRINASRFLNGFQTYPQELVQGFIAALEYIYPHRR